eukprot:755281-Hanusia_phi.AAC.1
MHTHATSCSLVTCILLLANLPTSHCKYSWVKAEGADLCAGVQDPCSDLATCSAVAYGACTSATDGPSAYVTMTPESMAWVYDIDAYATDSTKVNMIEGLPGITNGFLDLSSSESLGTSKYAYMMAGALVGQNKTSCGYIGTYNAMVVSGTIETTILPLRYNVPDDVPSDHTTKKSLDMCLSSTSNKACGTDKVTFNTADIAFMVFGGTMGTDYKPDPQGKHLGIRYKMKVVDSSQTSADMKFNGQTKGLADMSKVEVDDVSFTLGGKLVSMSLNKNFNSATVGTDSKLSNFSTSNVNIRANAISGDAMAAYLDILFPAAYFQIADQVVLYGTAGNPGSRRSLGSYSKLVAGKPSASSSSVHSGSLTMVACVVAMAMLVLPSNRL